MSEENKAVIRRWLDEGRLIGSEIVEHRGGFDVMGMLRQVGVIHQSE